jgi:hypothetical protein
VLGGAPARGRDLDLHPRQAAAEQSKSVFERLLRRHEDERQAAILASLQEQGERRQWNALHALSLPGGFLPLRHAAAAMSATEAEVVELVRRGLLAAYADGTLLYVQPAIVSVLAVEQDEMTSAAPTSSVSPGVLHDPGPTYPISGEVTQETDRGNDPSPEPPGSHPAPVNRAFRKRRAKKNGLVEPNLGASGSNGPNFLAKVEVLAKRRGRPAKTLLERVLDNSFRRDRYAPLLEAELLPNEPPEGADAKVWVELRRLQLEFRSCGAKGYEKLTESTAAEFEELVRYLHGAKRPACLR